MRRSQSNELADASARMPGYRVDRPEAGILKIPPRGQPSHTVADDIDGLRRIDVAGSIGHQLGNLGADCRSLILDLCLCRAAMWRVLGFGSLVEVDGIGEIAVLLELSCHVFPDGRIAP